MRKRDVLGPLFVLLLGMIGITFSVFTGSIKVYLIFIIPILVGKGLLAFISIALFLIGAIWLFIAYMKTKIHDISGRKTKEIEIPSIFSQPVRAESH